MHVASSRSLCLLTLIFIVFAPLVPALARDGELVELWTYQGGDGQVFGKEDIGACEEIQAGLAAEADETILFGQLEAPALWFHAQLKARLDAQS